MQRRPQGNPGFNSYGKFNGFKRKPDRITRFVKKETAGLRPSNMGVKEIVGGLVLIALFFWKPLEIVLSMVYLIFLHRYFKYLNRRMKAKKKKRASKKNKRRR